MIVSPMEQHKSNYQQSIFALLAILLVFAPIFRASNLPLPLLILELLSLVILFLLFLDPRGLRKSPKGQLLLVSAVVLLPAVYLLPLPGDLWADLPGRAVYGAALEDAAIDASGDWRSISLIGSITEYALWALIPGIVVFLAVVNLPREQVEKLVYVLIGIAVFQSILGLLQFGGGANSPLYFGNEYGGGSAAGTYLNRDHLAGFLEMVFPIVLALFAATIGHQFGASRRRSRWRRRLDFFSSVAGHKTFIFAAIGVLIILALIFTKSRMGVAMTMLGLFLVLLAFSRRLGGNNVYGTYGTVVAVIVVLAVEIGLAPVLDRFTKDPAEDLRWSIYSTSMKGVGDFFPVGSGPGTYPSVYPAYQPQEISAFINRAHNDYLEWFFDGGILAAVLVLALLAVFARQWRVVWIKGRWRNFRYIQVGAGIGIILMLIHSILDFNLHKPANAVFFAFLLAVFFRENHEEFMAMQKREKNTHRTRRMDRIESEPTKPAPAPQAEEPEDADSPLAGW